MAHLSEREDTVNDNPLIQISRLRQDIVAYTGDEELGRLLDLCAMIIGGNIPDANKIKDTIVRLEAIAAVERLKFVAFMGMYKGTENSAQKKNFAKEAYEGIDNLCNALKYMVKM